MFKSLSTLKKAIFFLLQDKVSLLLTITPVLIGLVLYFYGFYYFYEQFSSFSSTWALKFFSADSYILQAIAYIIKGLIAALAYFIVNWTFVLFVSLIGSPLNDFISARAERHLHGKPLKNITQSFAHIGSQVFFILFNEFKKISFILILSIFAFILSYIPFLTPFALLFSFLLISIQFVDYSWARHDFKFSLCFKDISKNIFFYSFSGALFFFFINIPLINLFVPALATAHFSLNFSQRYKDKILK